MKTVPDPLSWAITVRIYHIGGIRRKVLDKTRKNLKNEEVIGNE
jgi:hypothetical protein